MASHAEHQRAYRERLRAADPDGYRERVRLEAERKRRANPEKARDSVANARRKRPERHRARAVLAYHLSTGKIVRPTSCEECGVPCKPQGAHVDYARPLDVRWLCQPCHALFDLESL